MLLQLCGPVSTTSEQVGTAPFLPQRHPVQRDPSLRERGYPIYLLAEALSQIACRTARAADAADRRMLPVRICKLVAGDVGANLAATLEARPIRLKPLPEFACRLVNSSGSTIASATITVAPAEPLQ